MKEIHNAVVDRLGRSRPDIEISKAVLEPSQPAPVGMLNQKDLRICLYCLGFFNKQAFELDHIRPIGRNVYGGFTASNASKRKYNDPTNILPVCQPCNGSKSNNPLTRAWMDVRIQSRIKEGLVGMESLLPNGEADLHKAIAIRNNILGNRAH